MNKETFNFVTAAAEKGDAAAMSRLGDWYQDYNDVNFEERSYKKAFYWHEKAALAGNDVSMHRLIHLYQSGYGCEKNDKAAFDWSQKSADLGYGNGMFHLGCFYAREKDDEKSRFWFKKALKAYKKPIENGDGEAMLATGDIYHRGAPGIKQNLEKAVYYYEKAFELGIFEAVERLYDLHCYETKDAEKIKSFVNSVRRIK
jgi:TPR repeat protein